MAAVTTAARLAIADLLAVAQAVAWNRAAASPAVAVDRFASAVRFANADLAVAKAHVRASRHVASPIVAADHPVPLLLAVVNLPAVLPRAVVTLVA